MTESPELKRIELLKGFLEKDPNDAFSRYALALEYVKLNRLDEAATEFERLVQNAPDYTATYYHLGKLYEKQGKTAEAKKIYETGIALTAKRGETHANKELREALFMLTGGDDD
ncbi:MAG: tetratricopeptide repeat protein [Chloroherpetonaceae bacterium]|nr:tetratricopeptide repeat protein [Chloroherpetonaceae bacterium]